MPGKRWPIPIETIRSAAAEYVARTSLREAVARIGVSQTALHRFIRASGQRPPYDRTYASLMNWYIASKKPRRQPRGREVENALEVLVDGLSAERQVTVKAQVRKLLVKANREESAARTRAK